MASKYRKKFQLPDGFYEILESYSREVLRDQPLDIVEFSYLYFKALEDGTVDTFDYPRKGKNIPPSKFERPEPSEQPEEYYDEQQEGQDGQDPNQEYGDEYGEQNQDYDQEVQDGEYGQEGEEGIQQEQDYDQEGYGDEQAYGEEGQDEGQQDQY